MRPLLLLLLAATLAACDGRTVTEMCMSQCPAGFSIADYGAGDWRCECRATAPDEMPDALRESVTE